MKTLSITLIYSACRLTGWFQQYKAQCITGIFIASYLIISGLFLHNYFITDYTVWTALILAPYIIAPRPEEKVGKKYLWLSLLFLILSYTSGVKTSYFLAIGFAILFVTEGIWGNIGYLPLFLLGLISPTFKYFNNMLGFPVRLTLSEWAGNILTFIGFKVETIGNVIIKNGVEFSVDPACVGLKMMAFSILTGLLIMAYYQRQTNKHFSFLKTVAILSSIVGLNIAANLIRIVLLTIFEISPENPNHEIIGIICFVIYVIAPSYFLIKWATSKKNTRDRTSNHRLSKSVIIINILLLVSISTVGYTKLNKESQKANTKFHIPGYTKEITEDDIVKAEKPGILLYIKPISRFYGAEHNPMICWTGSGYQFTRINKQIIAHKEIYTGILKKDKDVIYAAWWFDNGKHQTISQMDWRWRAIKGENFYLVNVNSGDKETLDKEVLKLLNTKKMTLTQR